jgi:hypothetical protein
MNNPLLTEREIEDIEETTRRNWQDVRVKDLEQGLRSQLRIKQSAEAKIRVLREILDVRQPDNKSKQYSD